MAVSYNVGDDAPRVVAAGRGHVAERIIGLAGEYDIPTYYHPGLADELSKLKAGEQIPAELYEVVAQVLVFIGNLDKYQQQLGELEVSNGKS